MSEKEVYTEPTTEAELPTLEKLEEQGILVASVLVRPENNDDIEVVKEECRKKIKLIEAKGWRVCDYIDPEFPGMTFKWRLYSGKDEAKVVRHHAIISVSKLPHNLEFKVDPKWNLTKEQRVQFVRELVAEMKKKMAADSAAAATSPTRKEV